MNIKLYITSFLAAGLLLSSCSSFLDEDPEVSVKDPDYTRTDEMYKPVSGIYSRAVGGDNGFTHWAMFGLIAVRADDTDKGSTPSNQADFTLAKEFKYTSLNTFWALETSWKNLYNLIIYCNEALDMLDGYKAHIITEQDMTLNEQYKAQVRFIRAYSFFYLTRFWGDVPIMLDTQNDVLNGLGKSSREDVYNFIISELNDCGKILPQMRPNEMTYKGWATSYTALALKAKAAADVNKWDIVLNATDSIVNSNKFELYDDYYEAFKMPGKLSNESLFELQYSTGTDYVVKPGDWFAFQGPGQLDPAKTMSGGWGFMVPSTKIVDLFTARGETVRAETTFLKRGETTPEGDFIKEGNEHPVYNGKVYLPSTQLPATYTGYGQGNNIRMIRYADVLLLNAEAKVRKGQNGDAPFNIVRARAKMANMSNVTLEQVWEERQVELACEWGERFFDLVRNDKAASVLPGFVKGQSEFYPIPQSEIGLNPKLAE